MDIITISMIQFTGYRHLNQKSIGFYPYYFFIIVIKVNDFLYIEKYLAHFYK